MLNATLYHFHKLLLCTGQKVGNRRETRLFSRLTDLPTARRSRVSWLRHFFVLYTEAFIYSRIIRPIGKLFTRFLCKSKAFF